MWLKDPANFAKVHTIFKQLIQWSIEAALRI